jgi:hypothetical protein
LSKNWPKRKGQTQGKKVIKKATAISTTNNSHDDSNNDIISSQSTNLEEDADTLDRCLVDFLVESCSAFSLVKYDRSLFMMSFSCDIVEPIFFFSVLFPIYIFVQFYSIL